MLLKKRWFRDYCPFGITYFQELCYSFVECILICNNGAGLCGWFAGCPCVLPVRQPDVELFDGTLETQFGQCRNDWSTLADISHLSAAKIRCKFLIPCHRQKPIAVW